MSKLTKTIEIEAFTDNDGNPTCCAGLANGNACSMLSTRRYGTDYFCVFTGESLNSRGDFGTLIPCEKCPVWKETKWIRLDCDSFDRLMSMLRDTGEISDATFTFMDDMKFMDIPRFVQSLIDHHRSKCHTRDRVKWDEIERLIREV